MAIGGEGRRDMEGKEGLPVHLKQPKLVPLSELTRSFIERFVFCCGVKSYYVNHLTSNLCVQGERIF